MKILPASLFANAAFVLSLALLMAVGIWKQMAGSSPMPHCISRKRIC